MINKNKIFRILTIFFLLFFSFFNLVVAENNAPVITSNGGGDKTEINVVENQTFVTVIKATDLDDNTVITYTISKDAEKSVDKDKFIIDESTGVLSFKEAVTYDDPTDYDKNNQYIVEIIATDNSEEKLTDTQQITVIITNTIEKDNSEDLRKLAEIILELEGRENTKENRNKVLVDLNNKLKNIGGSLNDLGTADSYLGSLKTYFGNDWKGDIEDNGTMKIKTNYNQPKHGNLTDIDKEKIKNKILATINSGNNGGNNTTTISGGDVSFSGGSDNITNSRRTTSEKVGGLVEGEGLDGIVKTISNVVKFMAMLGFAAVSVAILWAGTQLVISGGNTSARDKAKDTLFKALLGLFFISAADAIVAFITNIFIDRGKEISQSPIIKMIETNEILK